MEIKNIETVYYQDANIDGPLVACIISHYCGDNKPSFIKYKSSEDIDVDTIKNNSIILTCDNKTTRYYEENTDYQKCEKSDIKCTSLIWWEKLYPNTTPPLIVELVDGFINRRPIDVVLLYSNFQRIHQLDTRCLDDDAVTDETIYPILGDTLIDAMLNEPEYYIICDDNVENYQVIGRLVTSDCLADINNLVYIYHPFVKYVTMHPIHEDNIVPDYGLLSVLRSYRNIEINLSTTITACVLDVDEMRDEWLEREYLKMIKSSFPDNELIIFDNYDKDIHHYQIVYNEKCRNNTELTLAITICGNNILIVDSEKNIEELFR